MTKETLEKLAAEYSESTSEIFTPNDFYGHAHILKTYCEINQEISLPGIYPHGISIRNDLWQAELKHPMPFLLLKSKLQSVVYSQYCDKPSWIIGAPNYYAVRLIEDELKEIQSNAKGTLILPIHSTHHLTNNYDFNEFVKYLKGLPEIHKPLTICLGWRDIQLKKHERYLEHGFECTTAGHMYDKEFFYRLVRIIASHQFAIINDIGTAAFYAAAMDLPVILFRQKIETNPAKSDQPAYLLQEANFRPCIPIVEGFIETCINPDKQMVQHQKDIAQLILGYEDIKKPDELRGLFESLWLKNEMKPFIKKPNYIAEGSLGEIIESIGKRVNPYPRKIPGRVKIDGLPFAFADLHSFYHQVIQIFGTDLYGFESETDEPVIVDCGAHIGLASLYFAKIFPKGTIYAFEADPNIARMLKENVQTLGLTQVKIIAKAVWIHNEGVQFNITGDDSGYVCLNQNTSLRRIPSFRLRDFLQNNKVDLLKIDIEGSEYDVIKDCDEYLSKAEHMIIEVHKFCQNGVLLGDILRILEKNGFKYSVGDLHVADWIKQSVKTPFTNLKTDSFIITIFAWQQNAREEIKPIQIHQSKLAPAIRMADITPENQCKQDSKRKNRSAPGTQILQVVDHQVKGGAAIAGYRLFAGLKNDGVNVKLISFSASARNELACHDWVHLFKPMPGSFNQNAVNRPAFPSQVWLEIVSSVLNSEHPEIINIHNIHEAIHYYGVPLDIIEVMACKARLVFTLHDMWLLTGRCAYAGACNRFAELSCNEKCPTVSEYPCLEPLQVFDALKRKRELLLKHPETVIVTPSKWLAGEVRKSYLGNHRIEVIPYGIDLDIFSPDTSRRLFREKCGIRSDEFVLLTAAADLNDKRKGMHLLWDALSMIKSEVVLMLVGNGKSIPSLPENVRLIHQGFVADQSDMARFYSAADLFICPTLADNLPCVLIESISCGTPCIGFRSGGVSDVIRPNITGWLVDETSAESLAKVINSIISNPNSAAELRVSCRRIAESEYAINMQAERYEALFRELIQNSGKMNHAQKLSDTPSNCAFIKNSPEDHYKSIQPLIISSRQKEACSKLGKFLESYPDFALAHNDLGVLYYKQGNKEKALNHYRQAVQFEPQNITFQKNLADFYYIEFGQVEEAMQIYVKVLNANPEDIETLLVLAHICVALEKFDDAKDFYNRILKIEPGNIDAREFLDKLEKCQAPVAGGQTDQTNKDADSNGYLVSAIVSTYNAERFIRGCLEDLENQTIADKIEIIVVDSGSQQGEEAVIREFQEKYSNIKYIKTDQRETVYAAWNRGIQAATGKYITNANADDRHRTDALEVMVDILETLPEISLVYADIIITETENEKFESCTPVGYFNWMNFSRDDLLNKGCFVGPQPMWRRDVHNEYGYFDDSFITSGDYEFWLRISQSCICMHLPVQLGLYLRSPGSIEHSNREKQREENNKIFKMYKYAQSSGKIIGRLNTCLSQDHTEQSSQNKKSQEESYQNIRAAMENKRPEEIIEELEKLSVSFPEFALVHSDLGGLYYNNGDQKNALNHYQKAVQLEPANATFQKNLADYYFVELDRKEEALQIYLSLLNHHPNDLELNLTAAHICVAVQNFSNAKVLYKRVLDIDPENDDARNNLRTLDKIKGDLRTGQPSKTESPQKSSPEEYSLATETTRVNDASGKDIPQFSIIMPTFAPLKQFRRCVESIKEHISESYEILFVNNGTTKGVLKWVWQCIDENHNWHLVKCGKGANPAVCYNTGIKAARGEYIVLLSNDVVVTDGWLSSMLQCLNSIPDAGMVGTMTNRARGRQKVAEAVNTSFEEINVFAESYRATNRYRRIACDVPDGFCLLFWHELTEKIGLFDEQMGALGFEDEDYCLRAALGGYLNQIAGDVYLHRLERKAPARSKKHFNLKWSGADIQSSTGKRHLALRAVEKANRATEEGKSDLAVELFLQAIGLLPEYKENYYKLAEMLVNTKGFKDALDVLNELPEGDPDARHLELAARCQEGLERFEEAERYADRALEINRCAPSALNTKGIIAFRRDDKNAAESYFTRAMETDPGFGEAYTNLGALKWAAGFKDEALSLYERGFILSPTVPDIALNYHSALADLEEYQRAESVVRDAAAVHPRNKKIRYMLIDILLHLQNLEMAMQEIETAIADFGVEDGILSSALKIRDKIGPLTMDRKTGNGSTVSLCMIAKDEEEHLARCLQSVRPVVDEIIVVDTGSKDRSRDIARVFGAKVFDFEWAEDFAEARNYSLSKATGKMVFVMDADEVISPLDYELFRQTARQSSRQRSAFIINTRNYTMDNNLVEWVPNEGYYDIEEAGTGWTPSAKIRLFPNDPHIRFDFPVHEMVEPSLRKMGIAMKLCKFQVHHYGKLNRYKSEKKGEAYYEIGCKKLEEMGDAPVALRELAIQAEGLKKHEEAVKLWERFIAIVPNEPKAYINMGISYCGLGQFDKVLTTAEKALKFAPDSKEGHFNRALAKLHLGHPDQAIEILEKLCEEMPEYLPAGFILAAACCCGKDKKRGMVLLKELSRTDIGPGLAIRCHELASRFVLLQRPAYALALLDAAIDSQNGNKDVLDLYADCLKMTNSHPKTGTYE